MHRKSNPLVCCLCQTWSPDMRTQSGIPPSQKCIIGAVTSADNRITMGMYKSFNLSLIILSLINISSNNLSIININMDKVVKIHTLCNSTIITITELSDTIGFQYMEQAVKTKKYL